MTIPFTEPAEREAGFRYLQYLEPFAFTRICHQERLHPEKAAKSFERWLKMHALWGSRIVIGSVTPFSSPVVMSAFSNEGFQYYVKEHPRFLTYKSNFYYAPDKSLEEKILSGLLRVENGDFHAAAFTHTDPVKAFCNSVLELAIKNGRFEFRMSSGSPNSPNAIIERARRASLLKDWECTWLHGALRTFHYLFNDHKEPINQVTKFPYVWDVLKDAAAHRETTKHEKMLAAPISLAVDFINEECGGDKASFSSIQKAITRRTDLPSSVRSTILETCGNAYNVSLFESFDPDYGALLNFKYGAPLGLLNGEVNSLLLKRPTGIPMTWIRKACDWDLTNLDWHNISGAMHQQAIRDSAERFQLVLAERPLNFETIGYVAEDHIARLNAVLPPPRSRVTEHWVWALPGVAIAIGALAGKTVAPSVSKGLGASKLGIKFALDRRLEYAQAEVFRTGAESIATRRH